MKSDCLVNIEGVDFECVDKNFGQNEAVDVVVRPEDIYLVEPDKGKIKGVVDSAIFKGVHYEMCVIAEDGQKWIIHDTNLFEAGTHVGILVKPFDIHVMKKSIGGEM